MMGGATPNIDRIANEGALMTDYYGQQSCITGMLNYQRALPASEVWRLPQVD